MSQQTFEGMKLVRDVQERGYAEIEHAIQPDMIEEVIERYTDFTLSHPNPLPSTMDAMLPADDTPSSLAKRLDELNRSADQQPEWHKYRTNVSQTAKPDGYTNRSFQERALRQARGIVIPPEDPKEFYHFTPGTLAAMVRNHDAYGWGPLPSEVYDLDQAFRPIHTLASRAIIKICSLIEETHPEIHQLVTSHELTQSPIRLLFYHPTTRDTLGAGHYDKGALTLQIAESHEGLRVAPNAQAELQPVVREPQKAVFFPAHGLQAHLPDTPFQPGWHDIVAVDRLNQGRSVPVRAQEVCARWALILFTKAVNFVEPDKAQMHTR